VRLFGPYYANLRQENRNVRIFANENKTRVSENNSFPRLFKDKESSRLIKGVKTIDIYSCYTLGSWQDHQLY